MHSDSEKELVGRSEVRGRRAVTEAPRLQGGISLPWQGQVGRDQPNNNHSTYLGVPEDT